MAAFFVDDSTGNDTNDGLDNIGVGLATATWTESTLTLTQSSHGYTFATGDVIFVESGTSVSQTGLYEVTSSTANNIVLAATSTLPGVQDANDFAAGDLATGDIVSSDGPWLTIDKAMDEVVNTLTQAWIKASGTYTEKATMDTAGLVGTPIVLEGYTTSIGDNGQITMDATGLASAIVSGLGSVNGYYVFKNIIATLANSHGFDMVQNTTDVITFKNCRAFNNGGWGFQCDNDSHFEACDAEENSSGGIDCDLDCTFIACRAWNNTNNGIVSSSGIAYACLVYDNGTGEGIGDTNICIACTLDGENAGSNGIAGGGSTVRQVFVNNILHDWTTGIDVNTSIGESAIVAGNLYNSNGSNTSNLIEGDFKVTAAPGFTDEAGDDYTLASDSAANAAGIDAAKASLGTSEIDIGALQRKDEGAVVSIVQADITYPGGVISY